MQNAVGLVNCSSVAPYCAMQNENKGADEAGYGKGEKARPH
jgi:hypothetical protein